MNITMIQILSDMEQCVKDYRTNELSKSDIEMNLLSIETKIDQYFDNEKEIDKKERY